VRYAESYYEQTTASAFSALSLEHYLNLWGEPASAIINNAGVSIHDHVLTGTDATIGAIGHEEVHIWYVDYVVDNGLAASVL
jgi:hypothetical protein